MKSNYQDVEAQRQYSSTELVENLQLASDIYEYARGMGAFAGKDPLHGIEGEIEYVRIMRLLAEKQHRSTNAT